MQTYFCSLSLIFTSDMIMMAMNMKRNHHQEKLLFVAKRTSSSSSSGGVFAQLHTTVSSSHQYRQYHHQYRHQYRRYHHHPCHPHCDYLLLMPWHWRWSINTEHIKRTLQNNKDKTCTGLSLRDCNMMKASNIFI